MDRTRKSERNFVCIYRSSVMDFDEYSVCLDEHFDNNSLSSKQVTSISTVVYAVILCVHVHIDC